MKHQMTNFKIQINSKKQYLKTKTNQYITDFKRIVIC